MHLNLWGCAWHATLLGDVEGAHSLLLTKPPGSGQLIPNWARAESRTESRREAERRKAGWGGLPHYPQKVTIIPTVRQRGQPNPKTPKEPKQPKGLKSGKTDAKDSKAHPT